MKKTLLKLAVLGVAGLASMQSMAAGSLCTLPAAPAGSAYINAYNTGRVIPGMPFGTSPCLARGNFGATARDTTAACTVSSCAITSLPTELSSPLPGYMIVTSATRVIPTTTGGPGNIGSLLDAIWRKPAANAPVTPTDRCIFGTRVSLINADHDATAAGTQYFEVNDIARGGFSGSGLVNVGYFLQAVAANPVYRAGRTFTSVQHLPYGTNSVPARQNNAPGHLDLPTIGGLATTALNSSIQQAQLNSNWVDFTIDAYFLKAGVVQQTSPMTYVEAACSSDNAATINSTWVKSGAIRLRQTAQGLKEIAIPGYAPPGAMVP